MSNRSLIAGLPGSGKSTYIGALWYNLRHIDNDSIRMIADDNLPENIAVLNKLATLWRKGENINRTNSNAEDRVQINLISKNHGEPITLEVPDFLGETFRDIITLQEDKKLDEWCRTSDSLLFFVKDVSVGKFVDEFPVETDEHPDVDIPPMKLDDISEAAKNIMILKYLLNKKNFTKVVIVLSWWDETSPIGQNVVNPEGFLKRKSPALFNFIRNHCKEFLIIGLSSQGMKYLGKESSEEERSAFNKILLDKTKEGKRAYIQIEDRTEYDLSLPISWLLEK